MTDEDVEKLRELLASYFGYQSWSVATGMIAALGRDYAERQLELIGRGVRAGFRGDERIAAAVRNAQMGGATPKEAGVTLQIAQRELAKAIEAKTPTNEGD